MMCRVMKVSKAGYYKWRGTGESSQKKANAELSKMIVKAYNGSRQTYGKRRVYQTLVKWEVKTSLNRVGRLMKKSGAFWL